MTKKTFLLVYNPCVGTTAEVSTFLDGVPQITHWRYDMPNAFLLISTEGADALGHAFRVLTKDKSFFIITEVSKTDLQGWLPTPAWDMIYKQAIIPNADALLPPPPPPPRPPRSLLDF